jgi:Rrf2 family protein
MITQKTKYALSALMTLADEAAKEVADPLTIEEIARRSGAPKRFLEHILLDLRNAGMISSRRGRSGGYVLTKDPKAISIGELLRRVDGPIAPLPCLSRRAYQRCADCTDEANCRIRELFGQVFWAYLLLIESLTLADLSKGERVIDRLTAPAAAVE